MKGGAGSEPCTAAGLRARSTILLERARRPRRPAHRAMKMSSCRHSTPFGMPVVPPV
jgi:hypothetical protein